MANYIGGIDHAIVGVRDLEQARASFERLGFHATPLARHKGRGTGEYCLVFADGYVELCGIVDPAGDSESLARFLAAGEGLWSLALRTTDPEGTHAAWRAAGLDPAEVADDGRTFEPDLELRCKDVMLETAATGGVPLFACAHLEPERMRRPEWLGHPNGARAIGSVTVVVEEPGALVAPMAKVFGSTSLTETDDTLAVHTGRNILLFATPDDLEMLHPELEGRIEAEQPTLAALTVLVPDLAQTAAVLDRHDVAYRQEAGGAIGIAPEHSHGVMLEFVAG
ncbi:MAG TPA: VOC family protein [Geminicoccaceae bacterium]|nr:VOC family protein [Geminicoccaceae bacterium]